MRTCLICGNHIKSKLKIGDKIYDIHRRKLCLNCKPFKPRIVIIKSDKICPICEKRFLYTKNNVCTACRSLYRRHKTKLKAINLLGGKCINCGNNNIEVLSFHHINNKEKNFTLSGAWHNKSWEKVLQELNKCTILCHNCHSKIHKKEIQDRINKVFHYYKMGR